MANFWTPLVADDMRQPKITTYEFLSIGVSRRLNQSNGGLNADDGIFLSNYEANHNIDGNEYIADLLLGAAPPPVTGKLDQEVQRLVIAQSRNQIGGEDFVAALGSKYFGARIEMASYTFRDGVLRSGADYAWRSIALLKGVSRDVEDNRIQLEITNSFAQLRQVRDLRTTPGSVARLNPADTSFNAAAALTDAIVLQWGSDPDDDI